MRDNEDIAMYGGQGIKTIAELELDPKKIRAIDVRDNQIEDIEGLDDFDKVYLLNLAKNPVGVSSLERVLKYKREGKLPQLSWLLVHECGINWSDPRVERTVLELRKYDVSVEGGHEQAATEQQNLSQLIQVPGYKPIKKIGEGGTFDVFLVEKDKGIFDRAALIVPRETSANISGKRMLEKAGPDTLLERELFIVREKLQGLKGVPKYHGELDIVFDGKRKRAFCEEYIHGTSLDSVIRRSEASLAGTHFIGATNETMKLIDVTTIIFGILETLQGIHSRGVVHNDIAPNNVIITSDLHSYGMTCFIFDYALSKTEGIEFLVYSSRRYSSQKL